MVKKNTFTKPEEKGLKKLLRSFWFWLGIWLVFYIIFVSMPVQWNESGYGWDAWSGINLYKTIFGYISAFAFLVAIILLGVSLIKRIQKSSIGDYWKISFTIIGIVLIIAFSFFYIKQYIPSEFDEDKYIKESLEEKGYEVIYNYYSEIGNETWASVKMKSLGNKDNQAWDALITMGVIYEDATRYIITLLTPTEECFYSIDGDIYRAYRRSSSGEKVLSVNGTELDSTILYNYIKSQIEESSKKCS